MSTTRITNHTPTGTAESSAAYLSCPQAAKLIGVSAKTLHREIAAGRLPAYGIKGRRTVRVKAADVLNLLERVA